ncbi:MAG: hypothetical protein ACRDV9_14150, partial [Acidimicrobiia bacterium]
MLTAKAHCSRTTCPWSDYLSLEQLHVGDCHNNRIDPRTRRFHERLLPTRSRFQPAALLQRDG